MGNAFHQLRRGVGELKESMRLSDAFRSVQQRKGDYYIKTFIATFGVSMALNFYAHAMEHQIESDYMAYRRDVNESMN